jgi:hypothetical protein
MTSPSGLVFLLSDFAFRLVGRVIDLGLKAFEKTVEEGVGVGALILQFVGVGDVAREIGEDYAPGEGIFPCTTTNADVLTVFGDPDAKDFEGGFVALCYGWNAEYFFDAHLYSCLT